MSYVDKNLMTGEHVIYLTKLHWVIFLAPMIWFAIAIYIFAIEKYLLGDNAFGVVSFVFIFLTILTAIEALMRKLTSEFAITNKRVLVKVGFIQRQSLETLLKKIEGIQVNQGILGRALDYGTIIISGTGGSKNSFHKIENPMEFRRQVQEQIAESDTYPITRNA